MTNQNEASLALDLGSLDRSRAFWYFTRLLRDGRS
jgi:hypothetical protein